MNYAEQFAELIELHRDRLRLLRAMLEWEHNYGDRWRKVELDTGTVGRRERTRVRRQIAEVQDELKRLNEALALRLGG